MDRHLTIREVLRATLLERRVQRTLTLMTGITSHPIVRWIWMRWAEFSSTNAAPGRKIVIEIIEYWMPF